MNKPDGDIYLIELSEWEEHKILNYIATRQIPLTLWQAGTKKTWPATANLYEQSRKEVTLSPPPSGGLDYPRKVLVYFYIKNIYFFLQGKILLKGEPVSRVLQVNRKILKYDKRAEFRFIISNNERVECKAYIEDDLQGLDVHDISVGGICIVTDQKTGARFSSGKIIKNIKISFNETDLTILESKISYIKNFKDRGNKQKIKIGIQFTNINPHESDQISALINKFIAKIDLQKAFEQLLA